MKINQKQKKIFRIPCFVCSIFFLSIVLENESITASPPKYLHHVRFTSQFGQDKWVLETIFDYKKNGFFIDIGASNGELLSNTYAMEKYFHWNGICIEANPVRFSELEKNRSSININACIDFTNHVINFRYDNDLFGGIVDFDTDNLPNKIKDQNCAILQMETKTLEEILVENNAPNIIDFLSIDVEGGEYRVFKNFPFEKYIFLCMVIERPSPQLNSLLASKGYVFVKNEFVDTYYVHNSIHNFHEIEKQPFEQIECSSR